MADEMNLKKNVRFKKGALLFKEGDGTSDIFIIKSGGVRIFRTEEGRQITLDTLGPGMIAGEIAMIDQGSRAASGVATSDTEAFVISSEQFRNVFGKIPDWFRKISLILVQRLREVDEKIVRSLKDDYSGYVAALVAMISYSDRAKGEGAAFTMDRKFLEYELMDLLAIPLTQVQGSLETLAAKGVLALSEAAVVLTDRPACEKLGEAVLN